jgi:hypothetical protein
MQVVLWLDGNSHSVFRSENHGKQWNKVAESEGHAHFMYDHPFDAEKASMKTKKRLQKEF